MDMNDRRKGCLYGQAIGDALGAYYEFDGVLGPRGRGVHERHAGRAEYKDTREGFKAGEWTDDTEQALVLALAFAKGADQDQAVKLTAQGLQNWLERDGRGCGNHTLKVLIDPLYVLDPMGISKAIWEIGGMKSAPNGGVMRAAGTVIVRPWDLKWTVDAAKAGCRVTHWDPRCVASVVAHNVACHHLMMGAGIPKAIKGAIRAAVTIEPGIEEFLTAGPLEGLILNDRAKGYTYKCIGAGFWALREFQRGDDAMYDDLWSDRFTHILEAIIRQRGDTDTNAAVAGAMMGSHTGFKNLPEDLVEGLQNKDKLEQVLTNLPKEPE